MTVPPGTPGAPMANTASSTQNSTMVPAEGMKPYRILLMVITKNTSVSTLPHRWIFANSGMPKLTISLRSTLLLRAHCNATARVAALLMVPTAVR